MNKTINNLIEVLERAARNKPDKIAYTMLDDKGNVENKITYAELEQKAKAVAAIIQEKTRIGDRVLLIYPPGIDLIIGFFACQCAGVTAILAYPPVSKDLVDKIQKIIINSKPSFCLSTSEVTKKIKNLRYLKWVNQNIIIKKILSSKILKILQLSEWSFNDFTWLSSDKVTTKKLKDWHRPTIKDQTLSFLQYTSGSTSEPKGVMVSQKNIVNNLEKIQKKFSLNENDLVVSWLPPYHDMGLIGMILEAIYTEYSLYLLSPITFLKNPFVWLKTISDLGATGSGAPNFAYELCAKRITEEEKKKLNLEKWNIAYCGAEVIRKQTLEKFSDFFSDCGFKKFSFYCCYGLAESTLLVTGSKRAVEFQSINISERAYREGKIRINHSQSTDDIYNLVSSGSPIQDHKVIVVNDKKKCAEETIGEIWISGPSVALGYWENPTATEVNFNAYLENGEGPFLKTGDLGFFKNGELYLTGRIKDLIILRGKNYYSQDIELAIDHIHPVIRSGCNVAVSIEVDNEERLLIICEAKNKINESLSEEMFETIRERIAKIFEIQVYAILIVPARTLKKTTSGKTRRQLAKQYYKDGLLYSNESWEYISHNLIDQQALTRGYDFEIIGEKSQNEFEQEVKKWFVKWLVSKIGIQGSKIDLSKTLSFYGLDSMLLVELVSDLEKDFDIRLDISEIWDNLKIAKLIKYVLDPKHQLHRLKHEEDKNEISYNQKSLWIIHQLDKNSSAYNVNVCFKITGDVETEKLKNAFIKIVKRHKSLHSNYFENEDKVFQKVNKNAYLYFWKEIDARKWGKNKLNKRLNTLANQSFDLERGVIFKCYLLKRLNKKNILLICSHHITVDFISISNIIHELKRLYFTKAFDLVHPKYAYSDFVNWQNEVLKTEKSKKDYEYWNGVTKGHLPTLKLPHDKAEKNIDIHSGDVVSFIFDKKFIEPLKQLATKHNTTLFVFLLASYLVILNKYSNQNDIVIGVPVTGRSRPEFKDIVGYFINTLPLRFLINQEESFLDLLEKVHDVLAKGLNHQDYPISLISKTLKQSRNLKNTSPFQVMMNYIEVHEDQDLSVVVNKNDKLGFTIDNFQLELMDPIRQDAQFELVLSIIETKSHLHCALQYNNQLFSVEAINSFVENFKNLLININLFPNSQILKLSLLNASQKEKILFGWNNTTKNYESNTRLHKMFEKVAKKIPNSLAVICGTNEATYKELNERANQFAWYLNSLGMHTNKIIAVCMKRSIEQLVVFLAILKSGCAYVAIDPEYPEQRIKFIFKDSLASMFITTSHIANNFEEKINESIKFDEISNILNRQKKENFKCNNVQGSYAYMIFTSGSTGVPKGVLIKHENICDRIMWYQEKFKLKSSDSLLHMLSFNFDASIISLWWPILYKTKIILTQENESFDPKALVDLIKLHKISILHGAPSHLGLILSNNFGHVRCVLSGGEIISKEFYAKLKSMKNCQLFNLYGVTESTVAATMYEANEWEDSAPLPIGKPIANTKIYILDSHNQPVPIGVPGEICIGGKNIAKEYVNRPDLNTIKFIDNPFETGRLYKTGDMAKWLPDGNIVYIGRKDYQIKIRGIRIEPGEIENVLSRFHKISEVVVVQKIDVSKQKNLIAYFTSKDKNIDTNELVNFLKTKLPDFMVPSRFIHLDMFPVTSTGKIDRKALPRPDKDQVKLDMIKGRTEIENELIKIWENVLNVNPIGIRHNFFECGGNSLLAIQLLSKVREKWNIKISLSDLFRYQTIENFASILEKPSSLVFTNKPSVIVPLETSDTNKVIFCIHPIGGNILCYAKLASTLKGYYSVYGIQSATLIDKSNLDSSIEQMAAHYIEAIKKIVPAGPYNLLGWSTGGLVALEMAAQMHRAGNEVERLVMITSYEPQFFPEIHDFEYWDLLRYFMKMAVTWLDYTDTKITSLVLKKTLKWIAIKSPKSFFKLFISLIMPLKGIKSNDMHDYILKIQADLSSQNKDLSFLDEIIIALNKSIKNGVKIDTEQIKLFYKVFKNNYQIMKSYIPSCYKGNVLIFETGDYKRKSCWNDYLTKIKTEKIEGNHFNAILNSKAVKKICDKLKRN